MTIDLNATTSATTTVRLELEGRPALIRDLQRALDIFAAEGIPDTFEVSFHQSQERDNSDTDVPYADRPLFHRMWVEAERQSTTVWPQTALEAMRR